MSVETGVMPGSNEVGVGVKLVPNNEGLKGQRVGELGNNNALNVLLEEQSLFDGEQNQNNSEQMQDMEDPFSDAYGVDGEMGILDDEAGELAEQDLEQLQREREKEWEKMALKNNDWKISDEDRENWEIWRAEEIEYYLQKDELTVREGFALHNELEVGEQDPSPLYTETLGEGERTYDAETGLVVERYDEQRVEEEPQQGREEVDLLNFDPEVEEQDLLPTYAEVEVETIEQQREGEEDLLGPLSLAGQDESESSS